MMFTRYLCGFCVLCLLAGSSAWAVEQPGEPGKPIAPKRLEFKNSDYKTAKAEALKQRKMDIRRVPPGAPLVAEIQPDGSIVVRHRPVPDLDEVTGSRPQ